MQILSVSIHPDDFCLCIGGTLALHVARQDQVYVLVLTDGEMGGDSGRRKEETTVSARILGIDHVNFLGLPDGRLDDSIDTVSRIEDYLIRKTPDRIYCCSSKDRHQDHRNGSLAVLSAARRAREIWLHETVSSLPNFAPTAFVDISSVMDLKLKAINSHDTQNGKGYLHPNAVRSLGRFRGLQAQVDFAEAFEIYKQVVSLGGDQQC